MRCNGSNCFSWFKACNLKQPWIRPFITKITVSPHLMNGLYRQSLKRLEMTAFIKIYASRAAMQPYILGLPPTTQDNVFTARCSIVLESHARQIYRYPATRMVYVFLPFLAGLPAAACLMRSSRASCSAFAFS